MTDKEKEAIEHLSRFKSITIMYGKIYSMHVDQLDRLQENVDIMLKLIEKQQAKIKEIKKQKHNQSSLRRLNERKMRKYRTENKGLKAEIEKKDKMIDLMAEQLTTPIHSKEWVIEYYTKEVEDK